MRRASLFGALLASLLVVVSLIVSPIIVSSLFDNDWLLYVGLLLGIATSPPKRIEAACDRLFNIIDRLA